MAIYITRSIPVRCRGI